MTRPPLASRRATTFSGITPRGELQAVHAATAAKDSARHALIERLMVGEATVHGTRGTSGAASFGLESSYTGAMMRRLLGVIASAALAAGCGEAFTAGDTSG